jgi:hypothetical protein
MVGAGVAPVWSAPRGCGPPDSTSSCSKPRPHGRPHTVKTTGGDKSFPIVTEAADLRKAHSGR